MVMSTRSTNTTHSTQHTTNTHATNTAGTHLLGRPEVPQVGMVTSSSAATGWMATQLSKSALFAPIFSATAKPCSTSSLPMPGDSGVVEEIAKSVDGNIVLRKCSDEKFTLT